MQTNSIRIPPTMRASVSNYYYYESFRCCSEGDCRYDFDMVHFDMNDIVLFNFDVILSKKCPFSMSFSHMDHNLAVDMNDIIICRYECMVTFDMNTFLTYLWVSLVPALLGSNPSRDQVILDSVGEGKVVVPVNPRLQN